MFLRKIEKLEKFYKKLSSNVSKYPHYTPILPPFSTFSGCLLNKIQTPRNPLRGTLLLISPYSLLIPKLFHSFIRIHFTGHLQIKNNHEYSYTLPSRKSCKIIAAA